jgi:signal peptidase I
MTTSTSTRQGVRHPWWDATKTAIAGLAIAAGFHTFVAEVRYIPSESMTPTLQVGDQVIVEKLSYWFHPPQRGDVVVFRATSELRVRNLKDDMIKRVIGKPGDVVAVLQRKVWVNGQVLAEPYVGTGATYRFGPVVVPKDQYFVLGDNRNHSYDSHLWGFLPKQSVVGHAVVRFYPLTRFGLL